MWIQKEKKKKERNDGDSRRADSGKGDRLAKIFIFNNKKKESPQRRHGQSDLGSSPVRQVGQDLEVWGLKPHPASCELRTTHNPPSSWPVAGMWRVFGAPWQLLLQAAPWAPGLLPDLAGITSTCFCLSLQGSLLQSNSFFLSSWPFPPPPHCSLILEYCLLYFPPSPTLCFSKHPSPMVSSGSASNAIS